MIYDFEGHTPKMDPKSWVASNSVIIGKVELKKDRIFGLTLLYEEMSNLLQ